MPEYNVQDFAQKIRNKYNAYYDIDDFTLVDMIVKKYPVYADQIVDYMPKNIREMETSFSQTPDLINPFAGPSGMESAIQNRFDLNMEKSMDIQPMRDAGIQEIDINEFSDNKETRQKQVDARVKVHELTERLSGDYYYQNPQADVKDEPLFSGLSYNEMLNNPYDFYGWIKDAEDGKITSYALERLEKNGPTQAMIDYANNKFGVTDQQDIINAVATDPESPWAHYFFPIETYEATHKYGIDRRPTLPNGKPNPNFDKNIYYMDAPPPEVKPEVWDTLSQDERLRRVKMGEGSVAQIEQALNPFGDLFDTWDSELTPEVVNILKGDAETLEDYNILKEFFEDKAIGDKSLTYEDYDQGMLETAGTIYDIAAKVVTTMGEGEVAPVWEKGQAFNWWRSLKSNPEIKQYIERVKENSKTQASERAKKLVSEKDIEAVGDSLLDEVSQIKLDAISKRDKMAEKYPDKKWATDEVVFKNQDQMFDPETGEFIDEIETEEPEKISPKAYVGPGSMYNIDKEIFDIPDVDINNRQQVKDESINFYYKLYDLAETILAKEKDVDEIRYKGAAANAVGKLSTAIRDFYGADQSWTKDLENIKTFVETGKFPENFRKLRSAHPLAKEFNNALETFQTLHQVARLNENIFKSDKEKEGDNAAAYIFNLLGGGIDQGIIKNMTGFSAVDKIGGGAAEVGDDERAIIMEYYLQSKGYTQYPEYITNRVEQDLDEMVTGTTFSLLPLVAEVFLVKGAGGTKALKAIGTHADKLKWINRSRGSKLWNGLVTMTFGGTRNMHTYSAHGARYLKSTTTSGVGEMLILGAADEVGNALYGREKMGAPFGLAMGYSMSAAESIMQSTLAKRIPGFTHILNAISRGKLNLPQSAFMQYQKQTMLGAGIGVTSLHVAEAASAYVNHLRGIGEFDLAAQFESLTDLDHNLSTFMSMYILGLKGNALYKGLVTDFNRLHKGPYPEYVEAKKKLGVTEEEGFYYKDESGEFETVDDIANRKSEELRNSEEYQKDIDADGNVIEGSELNNKLNEITNAKRSIERHQDLMLAKDLAANELRNGSAYNKYINGLRRAKFDFDSGNPFSPDVVEFLSVGVTPEVLASNLGIEVPMAERLIREQSYIMGLADASGVYKGPYRNEAIRLAQDYMGIKSRIQVLKEAKQGGSDLLAGKEMSELIKREKEIEAQLDIDNPNGLFAKTLPDRLRTQAKSNQFAQSVIDYYKKKGGRENVELEILTDEQFKEKYPNEYGVDIDAAEVKDANGNTKLVINEDVSLKNSPGAASHEVSHFLLRDAFKGPDGKVTAEGQKIIDNWLSTLTKDQRRVIDKRIQDNYAEGVQKADYYEEYVTAFVDALTKGQTTLTSEGWKALGKKINFPGIDLTKPEGITEFIKLINQGTRKGKIGGALKKFLDERISNEEVADVVETETPVTEETVVEETTEVEPGEEVESTTEKVSKEYKSVDDLFKDLDLADQKDIEELKTAQEEDFSGESPAVKAITTDANGNITATVTVGGSTYTNIKLNKRPAFSKTKPVDTQKEFKAIGENLKKLTEDKQALINANRTLAAAGVAQNRKEIDENVAKIKEINEQINNPNRTKNESNAYGIDIVRSKEADLIGGVITGDIAKAYNKGLREGEAVLKAGEEITSKNVKQVILGAEKMLAEVNAPIINKAKALYKDIPDSNIKSREDWNEMVDNFFSSKLPEEPSILYGKQVRDPNKFIFDPNESALGTYMTNYFVNKSKELFSKGRFEKGEDAFTTIESKETPADLETTVATMRKNKALDLTPNETELFENVTRNFIRDNAKRLLGGKDEIKNLFESDLTKILDRDLTKFITDKMPRGYGEPYKNWVKSIAPELIKLADTRVGPDGVLMGDPYVFVNRGGKQFQGLFYDARGLTESGKVKRISVAKNKENPAWSWKQPSVEDVVDFLTVNRPGRPRVDSLRKPVARVIAKTIVKDYVNKTIRDSWAERAELKEGEKLSKDNPFNALSKKEFEKIQADNIFTTVAETILRHEDFVASRTKVPSFKNIEKALDKKYGPTPEMKKLISTENIIRSIVDDFRKQQPQAFDDWLTNIAQGKTTGEWLAKNTKYRRYFDPAIIRDQYEKALAGRDDIATFTSELNRLPDKVTVNGKVIDLSDVKNRDYSLMSREVKVDGKKAYYEYDVDRIIDEYLPQVMESAKMFPTWLPKALGKTGAAQTLGLSDRGTGFGKLTSQERIYSKEQRIDNIKKQIKELQAKNKPDLSDKARTSLQEKIAKLESSLTNIDVEIGTPSFDAVTYEELAKRPEIKNQYENAVSNLGKDTHPVWKGIEERLDQLYKDDAIRKDLKKDFKDLSEAEAAEFINKKLNIGNNELRRDLYNAVQTTLDAYFKKGKTPQEIQDRAQFILQIKRNNTNATSGLDRMGVVVDAYYDPVGKDFSRETIKLEHLKPSVKQSMDVARAIIEGRWPKDAQKIMNEYKGVFAPKAKLDILDDIGKRTNTSNAARLILDLESLKNYKQTGTGKNYYDVILDNAAKDLKLTPRELRVIKSEAAADGVAEYLINGGDATGKTTLRNTIDNVKERKGAYENNKSDLVFSKTKQPSISNQVESMNKADLALDFARKRNKEIKKIRIFDFDDTVARTDSKVFYTKPNLTGNPTPKRKAIFMIGGPGSGKTNIGKGLKLGRDGFKVVNQDIFIEAEKAKAGLPESERGYTKEQKSLRGKIGAAGTKAAKEKLAKYTEAGEGMVIDGTGASYNATMKKVKALEEQGYEVFMVHAKTSPKAAIERNKARKERSLPTFVVERTQKSVAENIGKYKKDFGNKFIEIDTETIEYGKPLPDSFVSEVKSRVYENERGILNAEEFAKQGDMLLSEGATYDFSDFNRVVDGKKGPLFDLMKTMKDAPGSRDIFILTARAPESAKAIQEFLKQMGIDLPLENIVGLGNSTGAAKGEWVMGKAAEGYNDFFFADDAMQNVRAVKEILDQVDVKSQVQIARSKTKDLSKEFNKLIQGSSGVEWYKDFSPAKAAVLGKSKGQKFFLPPSAEDFLGLIYTTLGKGKLGENQLKWYERNLINPYARGVQSLATERTHMMADFKKLKKELDVPKDLRKVTESGFTKEQAVRVFLFENTGQEIPGISARDKAELLDIVNSDPKLKSFAQQIQMLLKGEQYAKPGQNWLAGTITTDLIDFLNTTKRNQYLEEFNTNVDQIYSTENLNKLEAIYGTRYRESMQNIIARMKSGRNRTSTGNRLADGVLDYINGAQGTIMFFNMRSALLQTISSANFINTSFNNPIAAGRAFANMPQYSKDFVKLMNSDYLVDRRNGLRLNISESEIADAAATSKNKAKAIVNYIIEKGYLPTRFADSFAIASGGATWYRNRINNLVKQGVDVKTAEKQAYTEFIDISEKSQQSSDPSKISAQQASDAGRVFLQFVNTPMQYTRLQKRAFQDLVNGRGDWKANISKILYYGVMQNLWFNAMQQGLFTLGFGDTDIDEVEEKKIVNTANGMADSILRGLGLGGMTVSVLKNTLIDVYRRYLREQDGKRPEYIDSWMKLLEFSPAIKSKFNKIKQAGYMFDNKTTRRKMKEKGFSLDNPAYKAGALVISAGTNVPLDRAFLKYENLQHMVADDTEAWERVANFWGWPTWQLEDAAQRAARKKKEKMK